MVYEQYISVVLLLVTTTMLKSHVFGSIIIFGAKQERAGFAKFFNKWSRGFCLVSSQSMASKRMVYDQFTSVILLFTQQELNLHVLFFEFSPSQSVMVKLHLTIAEKIPISDCRQFASCVVTLKTQISTDFGRVQLKNSAVKIC